MLQIHPTGLKDPCRIYAPTIVKQRYVVKYQLLDDLLGSGAVTIVTAWTNGICEVGVTDKRMVTWYHLERGKTYKLG